MAETFTPAVCGGRIHRIVAVILFSVAALGTAAALGALLGAAGATLPRRWMLIAAVLVAVLAGLREAGILRFGVPALRRQVPERWRRERPLAFWSAGYGVILGAGFGTFLPTATFWAACLGALALGDPLAGAGCLAAFGLGRGLMIVGAGSDPIRRLGGTHRLVRPVNTLTLALCAALLLPTAAFGAAPPPPLPTGQSDPSVSNGVRAYTDRSNGITSVVVVVQGAAPIVFPGGHTPSLFGDRLAYVDAAGIRVVDWRSQQEVFRQTGTVDKPSLSGTRLAYVKRVGARKRLVVRDIVTRRSRVVASVGAGVDLGRPSLVGRRIAWHEAAGQSNRVFLRSLTTGVTQLIASGGRSIANVNPVMTTRYIAWTRSVGERSFVLLRPIRSGRHIRTIARVVGPRYLAGNMAIAPGRIWVTRWTARSNTARILSFAWAG
jgi:sulfite exporter TauE/SafE